MINIRPITDLKNKYPEIEDRVLKQGEVVYLTKNGYGSMALIRLEKYADLMDEVGIKRELEATLENEEEIDETISPDEILTDKYWPNTNSTTVAKARKIIGK